MNNPWKNVCIHLSFLKILILGKFRKWWSYSNLSSMLRIDFSISSIFFCSFLFSDCSFYNKIKKNSIHVGIYPVQSMPGNNYKSRDIALSGKSLRALGKDHNIWGLCNGQHCHNKRPSSSLFQGKGINLVLQDMCLCVLCVCFACVCLCVCVWVCVFCVSVFYLNNSTRL